MKQPTENGAETSMDQFMLEIEEYAKHLKYDENHNEHKETTESFEDEQELEIDNIHQVIAGLKEEVQKLNDNINSKNKVIESIKDNSHEDKSENTPKRTVCGYWNKGFCREGRTLPLYYYTILKT